MVVWGLAVVLQAELLKSEGELTVSSVKKAQLRQGLGCALKCMV